MMAMMLTRASVSPLPSSPMMMPVLRLQTETEARAKAVRVSAHAAPVRPVCHRLFELVYGRPSFSLVS